MKNLYETLQPAQTEEELKNLFAKFFALKLDTKNYIDVNAEGFDKVFAQWRKFNITLGKNIKVISADTGESFNGVAVDIDSDGALVVDTENGRQTLYAGDVSIRNC